MVVIIGLLALAAIAVSTALTLRAVAELRDLVIERSNSLADLQADLCKLACGQATKQSRITRSYLVEILEKRLLPHLGYREPEKTDVEKFMLKVWKEEVTDKIDCGDMDAPQQNQ
jgi:hypothetical protein